MGCRKERYNLSYERDIKKILFAWLVSLLLLSALAPVVLADTTSINVTFNPEGTVDIDVSPKTFNFGAMNAGGYHNSSQNASLYFTLYNNGTVTMDTQISSNATTDSAALTLDINGAPGQDAYSFFTDNLDADNWIPAAASTEHDSALAASGSKDFDINLTLGSPLTSNFPLQRTTITLTGSVAS